MHAESPPVLFTSTGRGKRERQAQKKITSLRSMGAGKEAAEALKVDEGAAAVDRHDLSADGAVLRLDLAHALPGAGKLKSPDRQLDLPVLILATNDLTRGGRRSS